MTRVRQGLLVLRERGWVPTQHQHLKIACCNCGAETPLMYRKDGLDYCEGCKPS